MFLARNAEQLHSIQYWQKNSKLEQITKLQNEYSSGKYCTQCLRNTSVEIGIKCSPEMYMCSLFYKTNSDTVFRAQQL